MINDKIIREYDIRGIVGTTLTEQDAFLTGWSFGQYIHSNLCDRKNFAINVCRDGRLSSESLTAKLIEGLLSAGISVNDIGLGPTPMLYFSSFFGNALGGIMVTGSHNPPEYNGFKFILDKKPFFGEQIKELQRISSKYSNAEQTQGKLLQAKFETKYVDMLLNVYPKNSNLKVVWDPGNGAASNVITQLCKKLPGSHIVINSEVDGSFPAHHPDPTIPENLEQLIREVKSNGYDLGIAFDGDGDRLGVVDKLGRIVWGDQLMIIFSRDILKNNPGACIIADVKASNTLFEAIKTAGGVPVISRTGHSNIKEKMKDLTSLLGGEMSGHIFFADKYFGYDDGPYAAVRLIDILARTRTSLDLIFDSLPQLYNTPEIRLQCPDEIKFKIIEEIKILLTKRKLPFLSIDGIRYSDENGWWLLRASNTQDALICRFESNCKTKLIEQKQLVAGLLSPYNIVLPEDSILTQ
jgi:phosphomannomutase